MKRYLWALLTVVALLAGAAPAQAQAALTANGQCVISDVSGQGSVGIQVTGTFVGTLTLTKTIDIVNYVPLTAYPNGSTTGVTTVTAAGAWTATVAGYNRARVCFTAFTSGTANVTVATAQARLDSVDQLPGLGAGVATFLATPTSANLAAALTDETGSGAAVFATSPTLVTPALGTPSAAVLTNATGLPVASGISGLGTGVATFLTTPSSANLAAAVTDETGSGAAVFATSPTFAGQVKVAEGTAALPSVTTAADATKGLFSGGSNLLGVSIAGVENSYWASNGNYSVGTSTTVSDFGGASHSGIRIRRDAGTAAEVFESYRDSSNHNKFWALAARGTVASSAVLQAGDLVFEINGNEWTGAAFQNSHRIQFGVDGTVGTGDAPAFMEFDVSTDGTTDLLGGFLLKNDKRIGLGTSWGGYTGFIADNPPGLINVKQLAMTTSSPVLYSLQTWNAAGVTFTGIFQNVTDTASAAGSKLADLQKGSVSQFQVMKDGTVVIGATGTGGAIQDASFTTRFDWTSGGTNIRSNLGTVAMQITAGTVNATLAGSLSVSSNIDTSGISEAATFQGRSGRTIMLLNETDGLARFTNNTATDFTGLILGTNDASGIRIKKNSTQFQLRLGNDSAYADFAAGIVDTRTSTRLAGVLVSSATAPTISSGFGSSPSVAANNGTAAFTINVGTGGSATSGVIGLPTATTGWKVNCTDLTTPGTNITKQTAVSTTSATVTNYNSTTGVAAAWTASDVLYCDAVAF